MQPDPGDSTEPRATPRPRAVRSAPDPAAASDRSGGDPTSQQYTAAVLAALHDDVLERVTRLQRAGTPLPDPGRLADLLRANLPDTPSGLDPHYADLGPFYDSRGAAHQLGGISKQALSDRRRTGSVLAMRAGNRTWLYPSWQFTGAGAVHRSLVPALRALRPLDRWAAGVWLVGEHPDLEGRSPRTALREGEDPGRVAALAAADAEVLAV